MSLQDDIEYLKARIFALEDRVKTSPHFRWGTVVGSVPLSIILDGAADALPGTPANAGPKVLMVGERVRVELQGNRAVVHAAGGRANDLRGTSAQRIDLAMSGTAVEGMRFYDEEDTREYVWAGVEWQNNRFEMQSGTVTFTSIGSNGAQVQAVTFPTPFTDIPLIGMISLVGDTGPSYAIYPKQVTATGMNINIRNIATSAQNPGDVRWSAYGTT